MASYYEEWNYFDLPEEDEQQIESDEPPVELQAAWDAADEGDARFTAEYEGRETALADQVFALGVTLSRAAAAQTEVA